MAERSLALMCAITASRLAIGMTPDDATALAATRKRRAPTAAGPFLNAECKRNIDMEIKAKIVNAKPPKSKSAQMREIAQTIVGNPERAVFLDNFNDVHQFGKILRGLGCKASWRKQHSGGWLVWALQKSS